MNSKLGERPRSFSDRLCKCITMCLFFILPRKVSRIFVELSVYFLFLNLRTNENRPDIDIVKLNMLLNRNYNKDFVALPSYTVNWFWPGDYLNKTLHLRTGTCTLREALTNDEIMRKNLSRIAKELMQQLPSSIKYKLGLNDKLTEIKFKNKLVTLFNNELAVY